MVWVEKMSQKKTINSVAIIVGVLCVVLLIAMMVIYVNYNSMLQNKDSEIADLQNQIANLQSQLNQKDSDLNSQITRLERFQNLTQEIFYLNPLPFDPYSSEWLGKWNLVTTFGGSSQQENSPTFQISSPYHLWRINYSQTGGNEANYQFRIVQVIGSEEIALGSISVTGPDSFTKYLFDYNMYAKNTYYIKTESYTGVQSWTFTIEQLEMK